MSTVQYWRSHTNLYYVFVEATELSQALRTMAAVVDAEGLADDVIDLGVTRDENTFAYTLGALIEGEPA